MQGLAFFQNMAIVLVDAFACVGDQGTKTKANGCLGIHWDRVREYAVAQYYENSTQAPTTLEQRNTEKARKLVSLALTS